MGGKGSGVKGGTGVNAKVEPAVVERFLMNPDLSFQEIGERVGLSRERVRQIAMQIGIKGRERSESKRQERWDQRIEQQAMTMMDEAFAKEAVKRGMEVSWDSYYSYWVNGKRIFVRKVMKRADTYIMIRRPTPGRNGEFAAFNTTAGWLIIPMEEMPRTTTMFTLKKKKNSGVITKRHDWPKYLNAWHYLENHGPDGTVGDEGNRIPGEQVP